MLKELMYEPLYTNVEPYPWEIELLYSKTLRRLKHLAHFGAGSLISSIVHSRYEHTLGVWKLAAYFFPEDKVLRIAAILHDVGHLPFSHALESTLGVNHHDLTEIYIKEEEIRCILTKYNFNPLDIIKFLNKPSVLTGIGHILGLDHLDSFLRDTYMSGFFELLPKDVLKRLNCNEQGIETDEEMGMYLLKLIVADHELFLSPIMVGVDHLLAEAIRYHAQGNEGFEDMVRLTDSDLILMIKNSRSEKARKIINTILYQPSQISISNEQTGKGIPISVRKVYPKTPQMEGIPLINKNQEAKMLVQKIAQMHYEYEVLIK